MQKDEQDPRRQPEHKKDVWQELLGHPIDADESVSPVPVQGEVPMLELDPWSDLVHAKGTEVMDLHDLRLRMSDQDVEQALQVMQEEPATKPAQDPDQTTGNQ